MFTLVDYIRTNFNGIYLRIYSNGDYIIEEDLIKLNSFKVDELRLSIKPGNAVDKNKIQLICKYIPNVIIEVPVIPDDIDWMYDLIDGLETTGIQGVNLVEFFYNGFRAEEFKKRSLKIFIKGNQIRRINDTMPHLEYPVFGSKALAYKILLRAVEKKVPFFMNICSNKTKNLQYIEKNKRYHDSFIKAFFRIYDYENNTFIDRHEISDAILDRVVFKLEFDNNLNLLTDLEIISGGNNSESLNEILGSYSTGKYLSEDMI
jgi:pyruvate formate-lyase activating enzyme-like uncharacterized protein